MTTRVRVQHLGGSHAIAIVIGGVPRDMLNVAGDAWEGAVYSGGGELDVREQESPPRLSLINIPENADPRAKVNDLAMNVKASEDYVAACEAALNEARSIAAKVREDYVKADAEAPPAT